MNFYRGVLSGANKSYNFEDYSVSVDGQYCNVTAQSMFRNNTEFNSEVYIGDNITSCYDMFYYCRNFNQPVHMYGNVTNCACMFCYCYNFNQPITIPNRVTNCYEMFYACVNFNQPITIPNSVQNCAYIFTGCKNFNQPITIPNSVQNCANMFSSCSNFGSNIYMNGVTYIQGMLAYKNNSKRINIFCNNLTNLLINNSYSIVGNSISWTQMENGYYNEAYNIYLYNNYAGT